MIKGNNDFNRKHLLTAARFLGGGALIPVEIPEIENEDGSPSIVLLKRPSAARVLSIRNSSDNEGAREKFLHKCIAECVVDESGERLIPVEDEDSLPELLSAAVWTRLANLIMELANAASADAGTAAGNAPSGTPEVAPQPAALEIPPTTMPVLASTVGSASPTSSVSASESGT